MPSARWTTPSTYRVAIPPYLFEPLTSFRYGARRQVVGTYKDGSEGSFSLAFAYEWKRRMEALCDCKPFNLPPEVEQQGGDALFQGLHSILEGYRRADAARFRQLAAGFGATHAVVEARGAVEPGLPLLYADDEFKLYRITP